MSDARSVTRSTSTFKPRRRRMSARRRADVARWMDEWGIEPAGPPLDWPIAFGGRSPQITDRAEHGRTHGSVFDVVLDIGFGHGESVLELARRAPTRSVIGIEVHTPGVATVLEAVEREGLDNVRLVHGDALDFLERVPAASLSEVRIFFPDPWPKERQHHRRLVRADVVAALTDRLRSGGVLRLATDVECYADRMMVVCDADARLRGGRVEQPDDRPLTRFERRGIDEGRHTTDLHYERIE
jgi:tRNA (guanine-N7-)-methyltransferase